MPSASFLSNHSEIVIASFLSNRFRPSDPYCGRNHVSITTPSDVLSNPSLWPLFLPVHGGTSYCPYPPFLFPDQEDIFRESAVALLLPVSYTHLRAHETVLDLVCRLLLEK